MVLGVGIDTEPVRSFSQRPFETHGALYRRLFSVNELEECLLAHNALERFTARFCAKEALVKAFVNVAPCVVSDFQIEVGEHGQPLVRSWKRPQLIDPLLKTYSVHVSLSHSSDQAVAIAVVSSSISGLEGGAP